MKRRAFAAIFGFCLGCSAETIHFEFPSDDPKSVIVVLSADDQAQLIAAESVASTNRYLSLEAPAGTEPDRIFLFEYDQTLAELQLPRGALPIAPPPSGRRLPVANRVWAADLEGAQPSDWREAGAPPDFDVALDPFDPCQSLLAQPLTLADTRDDEMTDATPYDGGSVLVSTRHGLFFEIGPDLSVTRLVEASSVARTIALLRRPDGDLWLVDNLGVVWRGTLSGLRPFHATANPGQLTMEWADLESIGEEIYVVTSIGSFERFDGRAWEAIYTGEPHPEIKVDVEVLGPGEAIAVGLVSAAAHHYRGGLLTIERFAPTQLENGRVVLSSKDGVYLGTDYGNIFVRRGAEWESGSDDSIGLAINAILPLHVGLFVTTVEGLAAQFVPGHGFCESTRLSPGVVQSAIPLADGVLVISRKCCGNHYDEQPNFIRARDRR